MSRLTKSGRPNTRSWVAILTYCTKEENGEYGKWVQLTNNTNGVKSTFFANAEDARKELEKVQLDKDVKYKIFIQYNNAEYVMIPKKVIKIDYEHKELEE